MFQTMSRQVLVDSAMGVSGSARSNANDDPRGEVLNGLCTPQPDTGFPRVNGILLQD